MVFFQGAGFGLIASLVVSFWVVIGSIINRGTPPPPTCHLINGTSDLDNKTTIRTTVATLLQGNSTDAVNTSEK